MYLSKLQVTWSWRGCQHICTYLWYIKYFKYVSPNCATGRFGSSVAFLKWIWKAWWQYMYHYWKRGRTPFLCLSFIHSLFLSSSFCYWFVYILPNLDMFQCLLEPTNPDFLLFCNPVWKNCVCWCISRYIDAGKNPQLYTKDCLEKALGKRQEQQAKTAALQVSAMTLKPCQFLTEHAFFTSSCWSSQWSAVYSTLLSHSWPFGLAKGEYWYTNLLMVIGYNYVLRSANVARHEQKKYLDNYYNEWMLCSLINSFFLIFFWHVTSFHKDSIQVKRTHFKWNSAGWAIFGFNLGSIASAKTLFRHECLTTSSMLSRQYPLLAGHCPVSHYYIFPYLESQISGIVFENRVWPSPD